MNLNLSGKSVIVTGGGSNIGRAIGLAFAREGAHLTVAEIDAGQGAKVVAEAQQGGAASAMVVPTDVTRWESVQAMVKEVEGRLGRVDVLVNNVGWTYDRLFVEKERAEWEKEIQLNLWGMINCTRAVLDGITDAREIFEQGRADRVELRGAVQDDTGNAAGGGIGDGAEIHDRSPQIIV